MTVIGHEPIVRELRALATADEPAHAILLAGPESTGRRALAVEYARMLNCEGPPAAGGLFADPDAAAVAVPCGACRPCRQIADGGHPDIVVVGPGDTLCRPRANEASHESHPLSRDIRICQVRGIVELAARYPFEARHRVVIIDPAERLREEAANTLLKTLEEPPGHTVFVLIATAIEALLETIRSRCRRIDVGLTPRKTIAAALAGRGVVAALAEEAAEASRGRPGRAIVFAARPDLMGDRQRLLGRCAKVAAAGLSERMKYSGGLRERYGKDRATVETELATWEEFWMRDLRESLGGPAGESGAEGSAEALRAIQQVREDLLANVQPRPAFDLMLLRFPRRTLSEEFEDSTPAHG